MSDAFDLMAAILKLSTINSEWIEQFTLTRGRPPRVLHIGNIANNAYLNAKFLNESGVECDVVCYDYYHVMGCPEWEDADFVGPYPENHFQPDWTQSPVTNYVRPDWFVQGPQQLCVDYLLARFRKDLRRQGVIWNELGVINRTFAQKGFLNPARLLGTWYRLMDRFLRFKAVLFNAPNLDMLIKSRLRRETRHWGRWSALAVACASPAVYATTSLVGFLKAISPERRFTGENAAGVAFPRVFEQIFPDRQAVFEQALGSYAGVLPKWKELMAHYDAVIGYATDGVYPLLAGKRPYIAYEHGTIRNIPFVDDVQGQLCALTYCSADAVAITNADNILAAQRLRLTRHQFIPHPINDVPAGLRDGDDADYQDLRNKFTSDFIVFHPSRQHWESRRHPDWEKGNDFFIRGFARFATEVNRNATMVLVEWGASVEASKALIRELGIEARVHWIAPLPHRAMMRMIQSCDAVADQFYLGAFGSTMPKALACGRPALLYLNEATHVWCFPEMPPVVNVRSETDIFHGLSRLYQDKSYYSDISTSSRDWYENWHSSSVVTNRFIDIFRGIL